jgi:hypothetical protein
MLTYGTHIQIWYAEEAKARYTSPNKASVDIT